MIKEELDCKSVKVTVFIKDGGQLVFRHVNKCDIGDGCLVCVSTKCLSSHVVPLTNILYVETVNEEDDGPLCEMSRICL